MKKSSTKPLLRSEYTKNLFYDNLLLQEKNLNRKRKLIV